MLSSWSSQCPLNRPSSSQSHDKRHSPAPESTCPFRNAMRLTVVCKQFDAASVLSLFQWSCPSTVLWRISNGTVNTVNRMLRAWSPSHVCKEVRKGCEPASADSDAPCAIQIVIFAVCVVASLLHSLPALIFWRSSVANAFPVFRISAQRLRIYRTHLKLLQSFKVVRSASRFAPSGCSHYCTSHERQVHHVS